MIPLVINLLLGLVWVAFTGNMSLGNLAFGFVLGYVILLLQREVIGPSSYYTKLLRIVSFAVYFTKELIVASLRVAYDVVTPKAYSKPGIIALPLDAVTDFEITTVANAISLTPGTISLDVSPDRKILYVHCMFVDDPEALKRELKEGLERRVLEIVR